METRKDSGGRPAPRKCRSRSPEHRHNGDIVAQSGYAQHFADSLPAKPYCTNDYAWGLRIRQADTAKRMRYVQANSPWAMRWLIFDVDSVWGIFSAEDANLPRPFSITANPNNGRCHLIYGLETPVMMGGRDRPGPQRYGVAVEAAYAEALGADPCYSGLMTKNPLHPHWRVEASGELYDLGYLAEFVSLGKPRRVMDSVMGIGRNCDTFDLLRRYAYTAIRRWWGTGDYAGWMTHLQDRAQILSQGQHSDPLGRGECQQIGRSVARWTWCHTTRAGFIESQRRKGKASGRARRKRNAARDARIVALRESGESLRRIASHCGISLGGVQGVLRTISDRSPSGAGIALGAGDTGGAAGHDAADTQGVARTLAGGRPLALSQVPGCGGAEGQADNGVSEHE